jgi:Uma2 family endonuclease
MFAPPRYKLTYAEYLAREAVSTEKHEFINGEAYAMAGGTLEHSALASSAMVALGAALAGRPCRAYNSDARVRVLSTDASFYPDLSVVCGKVETAPADPHAISNPLVLVEVLSDSTEANDRGAKAAHYRRIESLREYVLVSQSERRVEVQRRNERGIWELHFFGEGERIELTSLGVSMPVDALYANPLG